MLRDTDSILSSQTDNSSKLSVVFGFDRELFATRLYERAFRGTMKSQLRKQIPLPTPFPTPLPTPLIIWVEKMYYVERLESRVSQPVSESQEIISEASATLEPVATQPELELQGVSRAKNKLAKDKGLQRSCYLVLAKLARARFSSRSNLHRQVSQTKYITRRCIHWYTIVLDGQ